jgi:hypothetical protein
MRAPAEGATGHVLGEHTAPGVQEERYGRFMERAADQRLAARVGRKMRGLVDELDGDVVISDADASEIAGVVRNTNGGKLR